MAQFTLKVSDQMGQIGDTVTATYTSEVYTLMAVYTDEANRYMYIVGSTGDKQVIRKMSINRDIKHARSQYRIAKKLIGTKVRFGVTQGWDTGSNAGVWFNEVVPA